MALALTQAEQAAQQQEVPVGAVLVLPDERYFAAHNQPVRSHDGSAHAEVCAIRQACAAVGNYRLPGATLYVTLEPCLMCAGLILHTRLARLVYAAADPKTGAVDSLYQVLSDERLNHQVVVTAGCQAAAAAHLLKDFFRQRRAVRRSQRTQSGIQIVVAYGEAKENTR